jgi:hypothetical protein
MLLTPDAIPDIDLGWRLTVRLDSLASEEDRPITSRLGRLIVGGVVGRAAQRAGVGTAGRALADSADRVLAGARADRETDPHLELLGYEAIMRAQMGSNEEAIELLRRYVAVNPDHSFQVGGNVHWWWRGLKSDPAFQAVMARR